MPEEQYERLEKAAKEAGVTSDDKTFEEVFKKVASQEPNRAKTNHDRLGGLNFYSFVPFQTWAGCRDRHQTRQYSLTGRKLRVRTRLQPHPS